MADASPAARIVNNTQLILVLAAINLIAVFLWRVLVPAHEYPMRTGQVIDIAFDTIFLICLVGMRAGLKVPPKVDALFWIGLAAGLGLFAIRFGGGNASWWTGHLAMAPLR